MHATEYIAAEGSFESQLLPQSLPQSEPAKTAETPLFLAVLTRWKLAKKNGAMALNTLLGHKEVH
jgi:hypothetical protein